MDKDKQTNSASILTIHTFGSFDLRIGGESLLTDFGKRSYKIFDLLKLFVTYKDKKVLPETIMEKLWPEDDLLDPKNALRTKIYRLRKMLDDIGILARDDSRDGFCRLDFQGGFYLFSLSENCSIDVEEFANYIKNGDELIESSPKQAIEFYQKALELYRGEYLAENLYSEWVIPARNYYHRLYFGVLYQLLGLLKEAENYLQIIKICERAFQIDPYEELIHVHYLTALINTGQTKLALSHYKFISNKLRQDLGVKLSAQMKQIYRQIKSSKVGSKNLDYWEVLRDLKEDEPEETAFYCDIDEFKAIYNLERRKSLRSPTSSFLGFADFHKPEGQLEPGELKHCISKAKEILLHSLRKGDVVSQWNEYTLIFIVTATSAENLDPIARRITNAYLYATPKDDITLDIKFEPITETSRSIGRFIRHEAKVR
ncbi:MAG: hypothetical protein GX351_00475 [Peptococcaceae bacterium]|nr:hypothetical protein [Peptococcaceae bacterium]